MPLPALLLSQNQRRRVGFSLAKPRSGVNRDERSDFVHDGSSPHVCRFGADRRGRGVVDAVRQTAEVVIPWKIQERESMRR